MPKLNARAVYPRFVVESNQIQIWPYNPIEEVKGFPTPPLMPQSDSWRESYGRVKQNVRPVQAERSRGTPEIWSRL